MVRRKIRVGLDFDGVVAYNPFRVIRPLIAYVKKDILGIKKINFFYPKASWQQIFWKILHESSVFPAKGVGLLRQLVDEQKIEAHLITARYSFLDHHLHKWLKKYHLSNLFVSTNWNKEDNQPHIFKEKIIRDLDVDYYIEDNLDIVKYLYGKSKAKIYWIYNLIDRGYPYSHKYPYLEKALEEVIKDTKLQRLKDTKIKN